MSEQKPQTRYVPLRVRFRSPADDQAGHEMVASVPMRVPNSEPLVPDLASVAQGQRRPQQIKELVRLTNLLRADLGLEEVLQQIVASTAACTGFRMLAINLFDEKTNTGRIVACAGLSEEAERVLKNSPNSIDSIRQVLLPEFQISHSYFIPAERIADIQVEWTRVIVKTHDEYPEDGWQPEDALFVPFYCPREQKMLGFLSLDDPEDGKRPTLESVEMIELFANNAAIAIDNARLFEQHEEERQALQRGISLLREDLEQLRQGNLYVRVRPAHPELRPVADAINALFDEVRSILKSMQMVTQAVDEHTHSVQHSSDLLAQDTRQQEYQVRHISQVIGDLVRRMSSLSQDAAVLLKTAVDAVDVTSMAQGTVDRAVEGMSRVREATLNSVRSMKALSESGQEINEAVTAIADLGTRMHLLALNAAIEATRAGEQGQGFALIAKETRTLASSCAEAAGRIGSYIRTFQHETSAISQNVEKSTQHVVMQTELITQAGVALEAISMITDQLSNLIKGISTMVQDQEQGSQVVVNSVEEIFRGTGDITLHMQEMQHSMKHLADLAEALRSRMSSFQLSEP